MPARADSATAGAPAKVNLFLRILAREESGYHGLETLFCAVSLADTVTVHRGAPGIRLVVEGGVDTGPPERNLAVRAAQCFHRELGEAAAVDIHLTKRIPSAAGLGGGSSDCAATLRALNALNGEPFDRAALLGMAIELGSDIPFFLCGSPLALAWSRGERLLAVPPLPTRPVVIAHPGVAMATPDAFRRVAEKRGGGYQPRSRSIPIEQLTDWAAVAALAENDFQPVVAERIPLIGDAFDPLRDSGASVALMAGSGSSVFGVFAGPAERDGAMERLRGLGMSVWAAETLEEEPVCRVDPIGEVG
ncbi:MAG: 4-(cytidine 5'-diphospho)-2-C-methyl-D-erythritol kinase [Gemmatimonadetes bacterium]|nr:4-(cytidine 5'-diphospho)-2-C-methyl-D-erythritol kinase [Gemmatimonadota bacterium]